MFDDIAMCMSCGGLFYILTLFLWKRKDIILLIQEIGDYNAFGVPHDAVKTNDSFNFYSKLFYIYCLAGGTCYFILCQTLEANTCLEKNEKFGRDETCGLFVHLWLPFRYNFTPAYEIICAIQYFCCIYAGPVLTIPFAFFVMLQHIVCKIRHLKTMAAEIFHTDDLFLLRQRLFTCIRYHQSIIRL